jgi:hypothetical protein
VTPHAAFTTLGNLGSSRKPRRPLLLSVGQPLMLAVIPRYCAFPRYFRNKIGAMSLTWNSAPFPKEVVMVSGAYLRQQGEILIAMSRATFDLGIARRLREMALELQARAAEQEDEGGFTDNELADFKRPVRVGT